MLKLEPRPEPSRSMSIASPLLALAITVVLGAALFLLLGKDPVRGLQIFFFEPLKSVYALTELAVKATPLILIGLGLAVCFRSNVWNIGAEGQFILGAIAASGVAMTAGPQTGRWIVAAVIVGGVVGGMAWAGIVAFLATASSQRDPRQLDARLCRRSVLGYLVYGPWKDPAGTTFRRRSLPEVDADPEAPSRLPRQHRPGDRLARGRRLLDPALSHLCGFQLQVGGLAPARPRMPGSRRGKALWTALLLSGGMPVWPAGSRSRAARPAHAARAGGLRLCRDHRRLRRPAAPGRRRLLRRS
jgi:simple sugar transport system permease protein